MKRWWLWGLVALLVGLGLWFWYTRPQPFQLTFFDIGEGDAALVQTPARQTILIDGGPDRSILQKLGRALPWTARTIDLVVVSHPHADHVTGLISVLQRYRVRQVLATGVVHTTPEYLALLQLIRDKRIPLTVAQAGVNVALAGGVKVEVLWPPTSMAGLTVDDLNAASQVDRIRFGDTSVLFTGDTPEANEAAILASGTNVSAQVLKIAHQGSRGSTSAAFLRAVAPRFAVISVGRNNRFGHPHAEVIERLRQYVPELLRTDTSGNIVLRSNGQAWYRQ